MIIKAKVLSTTQGKDGITTMTILTNEIKDNIDWVGAVIQIKKPDLEVKEKREEF